MTQKIPIRFIAKQIATTTCAAFIGALGLTVFMLPHKLVAGGFGGLALLTHYLTALPVWAWVIIYNAPLFLFSLKMIGWRFVVGSLYGTVMYSFLIFATTGLAEPMLLHNPLVSAIFGGVFGGVGTGIAMRVNSSLGGTDIIGAIVRKRFSIPVGTTSFLVNTLLVLLTVFTFGANVAAYAIIAILAFAMALDKTLRGINTSLAVFIISSKHEEIAKKIMEKLSRGVTYLEGEGAFYGNERTVLYCVVSTSQLARVKYYVREIDPQAFMTVADVTEVVGAGFKPSPF